MKSSLYLSLLAAAAILPGVTACNQEKEPMPPVDKNGIHYIASLKQLRTFADGSTASWEYAITYTEPDETGVRQFAEVLVTTDKEGTERTRHDHYVYDKGEVFVSGTFEDQPDRPRSAKLKFNKNGTIKQMDLLADKTYTYHPYNYRHDGKLCQFGEGTFRGLEYRYDAMQWTEENITQMTISNADLNIYAEKITCTYSEYDNRYSIDPNSLLDNFIQHPFDKVMPVFPRMTCEKLLSSIQGPRTTVDYDTMTSETAIGYEVDAAGRIARMTVAMKSAPKEGTGEDATARFTYTDVIEFTYL